VGDEGERQGWIKLRSKKESHVAQQQKERNVLDVASTVSVPVGDATVVVSVAVSTGGPVATEVAIVS
jgi:hypothetical protein